MFANGSRCVCLRSSPVWASLSHSPCSGVESRALSGRPRPRQSVPGGFRKHFSADVSRPRLHICQDYLTALHQGCLMFSLSFLSSPPPPTRFLRKRTAAVKDKTTRIFIFFANWIRKRIARLFSFGSRILPTRQSRKMKIPSRVSLELNLFLTIRRKIKTIRGMKPCFSANYL